MEAHGRPPFLPPLKSCSPHSSSLALLLRSGSGREKKEAVEEFGDVAREGNGAFVESLGGTHKTKPGQTNQERGTGSSGCSDSGQPAGDRGERQPTSRQGWGRCCCRCVGPCARALTCTFLAYRYAIPLPNPSSCCRRCVPREIQTSHFLRHLASSHISSKHPLSTQVARQVNLTD